MPPKQVLIDLLSSPEVRLPPPKKMNAPPANAITYGHSKPDNDGFVSLSSDPSELPAEELAPRPSTVFGGSSWNFDNLEDSQQKLKPAAPAVPTVKSAVKVTEFGFLEDDFDSTVNFDDSMINDLLPPKKRRLSLSPKPAQKSKARGYSRSHSNIEPSTTKASTKRANSAPLKRAYTSVARMESDPILFTSSPDHFADAARKRRERKKMDLGSDDDMDLLELPTGGSMQDAAKQDKGKGKMPNIFSLLSSDDSSILALEPGPRRVSKDDSANQTSKGKPQDFVFDASSDLDIPVTRTAKAKPKPKSPIKPKPPAKSRSKTSIAMSSILDQYASSHTDDEGMGATKVKPRSKPKPTGGSSQADTIIAKVKADRAKAKAAEAKADVAEAKKAAKEAEKEEKRLVKERKARDKQKAAKVAIVNTLRTDKKLTTPEMIVELPSCLEKKLKSQTKTFLEDVKADFTEWDSSQPIVKWRRKIVAELDEEEGIWKPVYEPFIKSEKHVMYVMTAKELVRYITGDEGYDLDTLIATLNSVYESSRIIFLVEGVTAWFRRNLGIKKKQFETAVRSHDPPTTQPTASQRRKAKEDEYVDEKLIENALMELQVSYGFLIHHTGTMPETAQWIKIFTENISQVPYKKINLDTGFCMETGQVKTGENTSDTYTKMLQEMVRVTLPVAMGIAYEYPTIQQLIKGLEKNGPTALEDCRKSANKDGAFTDRKVGKAISKRVYDVFMGKDAASWDV